MFNSQLFQSSSVLPVIYLMGDASKSDDAFHAAQRAAKSTAHAKIYRVRQCQPTVRIKSSAARRTVDILTPIRSATSLVVR